MNEFCFYNDSNTPMRIHPGTGIHGVACDMSPIPVGGMRLFQYDGNRRITVKYWGDMILVSSFLT